MVSGHDYNPCLIPSERDPSVEIWCDSNGWKRILVPDSIQLDLTKKVHNLCHPGVKRTLGLLKQEYYWPNMGKEVANFL